MHQGIHDHLTSLSVVPSLVKHVGGVNAGGAALDVRCDGRPDSYVQEHKQQCSNAYSGGFLLVYSMLIGTITTELRSQR